ncbi:MAG: hypothetical protein OM95_05050 [Bdellovibrio sp. ArHS]|nr:MAG: hypothetical protein OM95_05050 [Bdellovibrio sp. ArHS]
MEIVHVGGPTVLIEIDGYKIITDPTFDEAQSIYPGPVTLHKTEAPAVDRKDLGKIDLVLLTHDEHADNLDHSGRELLPLAQHVLTTQSGAKRLKNNAVGMSPWDERRFRTPNGRELKITATPAQHGPEGIEAVVGEVIGFVITDVNSQQDLFYITGDTVWYPGVKMVVDTFKPKYIFAFAGAAHPTEVPVRLTMDTNEVLSLSHASPNSKIIPVHQDNWQHFTQGKMLMDTAFAMFGLQKRLIDLAPGTRMILNTADNN